MRKFVIKKLALLLAAALVAGLVGCGTKSEKPGNGGTGGTAAKPAEKEIIDSSTLKVDRSLFYGACYTAYEAESWHHHNALDGIAAMEQLGAKSFRIWIRANYIMSDPQTFRDKDVEIVKKVIADAQKRGIQVIGMNLASFNGSEDAAAAPMRNMEKGSGYEKFLLNYEETWYQLATKFPEITVWEIGNEWNNDVFLHPYDYESTGMVFTFSEKADITTDMLYYASKGIHRANPKALTVLGGLCGNIKGFLNRLYENIESGEWPSTDPDYYFQIAAWHPYHHEGLPGDDWVQEQKDIYQVVLDHEGHDKVVLFTEFGYSDYGNLETDAKQKDDVTKTLELMEQLPFVQSVHWFTMFNDSSAVSWGGLFETGFGLFTEPDESGAFKIKAKGQAFLEKAGGTGKFTPAS